MIIVDKKIPAKAKQTLGKFDKVIQFETENITYESISGHPDIFFTRIKNDLIIAPNLPDRYKRLLKENNHSYTEGETPVGSKYPETAGYNVVFTDDLLIHNFRYTDPGILDKTRDADPIQVKQAYTRCNLIPLPERKFITSDTSIHSILYGFEYDVLFVDPKGIILPGFEHGFFGGCCGTSENKFFIIGNLSLHNKGDRIRDFIKSSGFEIIELYEGPLFDGGSILFI